MSGYLFKIVRESLGLTQVELAVRLGVDATTVQGWESGRRPLTALRAGDLARLRMMLVRFGAPPSVSCMLSDAIEADLVITDAVSAGDRVVGPERHPLAASVHRRDLNNLITWPLTGILPPQFAPLAGRQTFRRGPVADRPVLTAAERTRLFDHLLVTADAHRGECDALLRRQAIYLLGFDTRSDSVNWLAAEQRHAVRSAGRSDHVPSWVAVRSSAIGLARSGNKDPLRAFVSTGLTNDAQDVANLNYWAYWVGDISEIQADDVFMVTMSPEKWSGARLFAHLIARLDPGSDHAELNIHTLWTLLAARPAVLDHNAAMRASAQVKVEQAASDPELNLQARRELASVAYAIRLADR